MKKLGLLLILAFCLSLNINFSNVRGWADQVDFPDIYINASAGGGGVGSQADPYNSFAQINWTTGGDNSIFDYYAGTPTASVTINLNRGEVWTSTVLKDDGISGTAIYPLIIQPYGAGAKPIINGASVLTTWIVADDIDDENFIDGGKFEDAGDIAEWTPLLGATLDSVGSGESGNCLRITGNANTSPTARQNFTIGVKPGNKVEVSWYVKEGTEASYNIRLYDVTNGALIWAKGSTEAGATWGSKQTSGAQTIPALCEEIYVDLRMIQVPSSSSTIFFDEVCVFNPEIYKKDCTNEPRVVVEDDTFMEYLYFDTDFRTTFDDSSPGQWSYTGSVAYVRCTNSADPDTHTMEVAAETDDDQYGIWLKNASYITIDGLQVQYTSYTGIYINLSGGSQHSNIIIKNCTLNITGHAGIHYNAAGGTGWNALVDCENYNNTITYSSGHGIQHAYGTSSAHTHHNNISDAGWRLLGPHGISQWSNSASNNPRGNIIELNIVCRTKVVNIPGAGNRYGEGTGIHADGYTQNSIIRLNISYDNEGSCYYDNGLGGNSFYYNVGWGSGEEALLSATAGFTGGITLSDLTTGYYYNNVLYGNYGTGVGAYAAISSGVYFKNNIIAENTVTEYRVAIVAQANFNSDYSCVYHSAGGDFMRWGAAEYTWQEWLDNTPNDDNSLNEDPKFVNPGADDFALLFSSPCINRGAHVGLFLDFLALPVPIGHAPDMGAYEHKNGGSVF